MCKFTFQSYAISSQFVSAAKSAVESPCLEPLYLSDLHVQNLPCTRSGIERYKFVSINYVLALQTFARNRVYKSFTQFHSLNFSMIFCVWKSMKTSRREIYGVFFFTLNAKHQRFKICFFFRFRGFFSKSARRRFNRVLIVLLNFHT